MKTKKRDMNFEALRIVSMLLIVIIHYVSHTEISESVTVGSFNFYLIEILKVATRASVNLYVLISGYYLINSKIKLTKLFDICIMVLFYSVIFLPIPYIMNSKPEFKYLISTFFPINSGSYWFATTYIVLYTLSPFLNMWLNKLNKKQYKMLLIILGIPLVITKTLFHRNVPIDAMGGASLIFFIYLYMIAGYIRLHYDKKINKGKCLFIALVAIAINCAIKCIAVGIVNYSDGRTLNYSNFFTVVASVGIFLFFRDIKIKDNLLNKAIGVIAPLTFGVYLIHENIMLKMLIWRVFIYAPAYADSPYLILHILMYTLVVFVGCAIIEFIRQQIFKLLGKAKISQKIRTRIEKANTKFWNYIQ